ncbi:class I SAM-dependent methyltransferase [Enterococcus raffinosus]|uniref:Class I SAM-dependent methyltransferase n=1 Tax=Enterococcus raffinosus TaxID=71452 RepID=A0AAW8T6A6_9ENTE|nr:class I SAM-dependent methyltransferase [Enterococcus raffinosus]MDT2521810.1 class I SAM-dependent methyltransferase [Enterococcus raffinosus]MDT2529119.1 class I SAM-dependent methyltransferase [Enterococcus raffinosus]MDT2532675.1 class I SAM-dependent methyltransferase [Enterococcus raffinosus]MDT2544458.1 class I SAM-dependent methyltransferase [Enterococcus raffinosus]MDT2556411.1 class I SAM-dependent methyltransferase [Enterococcus raffinosus]
MNPEKIETAFSLMEEAIIALQHSLGTSFFDAYIENTENLVDNAKVRVLDQQPDEATVKKVEALYQELLALELEKEDWRKLTQLVLLKGSKTESLQPNHQLTPDSIGFLFVFLIEQLTLKKEQPLDILDIAVGMGNLLLTTVINLQAANYTVKGIGVDNDETLLAIAASDSLLMDEEIQLFHQDSLQDLLVDPVDYVIGDLPVGYYPNDQQAEKFATHSEKEHSYAHHLLMEQGMKYVKPDGFGLFLVPSNFLETEQGPLLQKWLKDDVLLQGIIQLPDELFKSEHSRKSILLLQKKGEIAQQAEKVLLVHLPSLKDPAQVTEFFKKFEDWKSSNL